MTIRDWDKVRRENRQRHADSASTSERERRAHLYDAGTAIIRRADASQRSESASTDQGPRWTQS